MIITINEKNQKLYNDFFIEAYEDAKKFGILEEAHANQTAFTNLWQYYYYLPELAKKKQVYYTKLPLDEPMMEINGDSREVKVPAQLAKCAGVQNDHLAESIMFSIGRFHDGQDLMNATIWIQWTADNNGNKVEGVTAVPKDYRDIDFAQGTIRFPWILDSSVTQYPGIIEFAAVFFIKSDNFANIAYRYSTLPAKIKIEPALQKDLADNALDVGGMFAAAVRQNNYGPGFYVPVTPYFIASQGGIDLDESANLDYSTNENGILTLVAQATVTDTGIINYKWKHILPESSIEFDCGENITFTIPAGTTITENEEQFINKYKKASSTLPTLTEDRKIEGENDYTFEYSFGEVTNNFIKVNKDEINSFDKYYDSTGKEYTSSELKDATEVYEYITQFNLPSVEGEDTTPTKKPVTGKYFVVATNTITAHEVVKESEPKYSTITTLISPRNLVIGEQNEIETITYANGKAILDTKLETVDGEIYVVTGKKSTVGVTNDNNLSSSSTVSGISLNNNKNIELASTTEPCWFQATITAKRNRENKSGVTKIWRIVNPVEAPVLFDRGSNEIDGNEDNTSIIDRTVGSSVLLQVGAKINDEVKSLTAYFGLVENPDKTNLKTDSYYCHWYKQKVDGPEVFLKEETEGEYTIGSFQRFETYICKLYNTLNDKTSEPSCYYFTCV